MIHIYNTVYDIDTGIYGEVVAKYRPFDEDVEYKIECDNGDIFWLLEKNIKKLDIYYDFIEDKLKKK